MGSGCLQEPLTPRQGESQKEKAQEPTLSLLGKSWGGWGGQASREKTNEKQRNGKSPYKLHGRFYHGDREKQPGLEGGGGGCNEGKKLQRKLLGCSLGSCPTLPRFPSMPPGCSIPFPPAPSIPLAPALSGTSLFPSPALAGGWQSLGTPVQHSLGNAGQLFGSVPLVKPRSFTKPVPAFETTILSKLVEM